MFASRYRVVVVVTVPLEMLALVVANKPVLPAPASKRDARTTSVQAVFFVAYLCMHQCTFPSSVSEWGIWENDSSGGHWGYRETA